MTDREAPSPGPEPSAAAEASADAERRLAEAAARSPELAGMLAAGRIGKRPRRPRRAALLVAGVAVGAVLAALAAGRGRPPAPPAPPASTDGSASAEAPSPPGTLIPPLETVRDASGEETAPFSGFAVSVETEPPGAVVAVDGVVRGESPVFTGLTCSPGASIRVRAEKPGLAPREARTACRADTLVKLTIRLGR